jgi:BirA family biotin operon repressor/biotin-[acetyl-CoA-carboxylase] ligase
LEVYLFDELDSTQKYLLESLRDRVYQAPCSVIALNQTDGIGSRDNSWSGREGNFFASIAVDIDMLPSDLPLASSSIYFSYIMKKVLVEVGIDIWLKWPNDFYYGDDKVGGTITKVVDNIVVCGIGINLRDSIDNFVGLDSSIKAKELLELYIEALTKFPKWKHIFIEYEVEFAQSKKFSVHIENIPKDLQNALLCEDGSLIIDGKRVFSLR